MCRAIGSVTSPAETREGKNESGKSCRIRDDVEYVYVLQRMNAK